MSFSLLPTVNLPPLILAHAVFMCLIGMRWIFQAPSAKPSRASEASAMAGITTLGIGLAYLSTSYMPIAENHFLHASVPVRVLLALVAASRLLLFKNVSSAGRNEMLFVFLYDGFGGLLCGWQLDNFTGRVLGS
jgi:hypothetical protein